jgi:hypothetical protein
MAIVDEGQAHHCGNVQEGTLVVGPLVLGHALDSALLYTELASDPHQLRVERVSGFEALAGYGAIVLAAVVV